jgi:hypothetical protein
MHEAAGSRMDAPKSAVATITDTLILLSIDIFLAEFLPFVQRAPTIGYRNRASNVV